MQSLDQRTADDDRVGHLGGLCGGLGRRNAEAERKGQTGFRARSSHHIPGFIRKTVVRAGDAGAGHAIDETACAANNTADARGRARGGDQADGGDAVAIQGLIGFARLLGGQVEHEETVDPGVAHAAHTVLETAVGEQGVQVTVEDDRQTGTRAQFANHVDHPPEGGAGPERAFGGFLVDAAIGQRVGKWYAQFHEIHARALEREHVLRGAPKGRIAGGDIRDRSGAPFTAEFLETLLDPAFLHVGEYAFGRRISQWGTGREPRSPSRASAFRPTGDSGR